MFSLTLHYTPHYKFFWRFFHCKIKRLFWTFKRFLWREKLSTPIYYMAEVSL